MTTRYADLVRAVTEGLGMAMRDCYAAMGPLPQELRLTGGAARSKGLRAILGSVIHSKVRTTAREEAGAAGAAMMAAVAIGAYPDMNACIAEWVTPLLSAPEDPDPQLVATYDRLFPAFLAARSASPPVWEALAHARAAATPSGDK
jgi:erythritol kinase